MFVSFFLSFSCGTFQNLREVIWETQLLAFTCLPRKKSFFVRRGTNYLTRYFMLILINAYMTSEVKVNFQRVSFAEWLAERPEIPNILATLQYPEELPPHNNNTATTAATAATTASSDKPLLAKRPTLASTTPTASTTEVSKKDNTPK